MWTKEQAKEMSKKAIEAKKIKKEQLERVEKFRKESGTIELIYSFPIYKNKLEKSTKKIEESIKKIKEYKRKINIIFWIEDIVISIILGILLGILLAHI